MDKQQTILHYIKDNTYIYFVHVRDDGATYEIPFKCSPKAKFDDNGNISLYNFSQMITFVYVISSTNSQFCFFCSFKIRICESKKIII